MEPRSSTLKWMASATPGSAIPPTRCWRSASPPWKEASRRSSVACGQAAVNYSVINIAEIGTNIVSVPQLYGTTHTLFAHILPRQGITVRFSEDDRPESIGKTDRRQYARGVLRKRRKSGRKRLRHRSDGRGRAQARRAADRRQHGADADPAQTDRIRRGHRGGVADEVHGRARHHARRNHRRQRQVPVGGASPALSDDERAGEIVPRAGLHRALRAPPPTSRAAAPSPSGPPAPSWRR